MVPRAHGNVSGRRLLNRMATAATNPARMRLHSRREPSSADHSERTLKNSGVSRLEFSATYRTEKSFERMAAIMAPLAARTRAKSDAEDARALSTNAALRVLAATNEATHP